jgi:poly(3-hydroxybutyrate) depolymerase
MRRAVLACCVLAAAVRADVSQVGHDVEASRDTGRPSPLLVVLHGNNETGQARAQRWRATAELRGWKVLALDCPRDLGCDARGRWYLWNGDPSWVRDQVKAFAARDHIDMSRVFLAGWSGGATYIGKRFPAWDSMFAGIVIHGGGVPPLDDECPDRRLPTYFLVGDKNPMHDATRRLREYLERCDQDVRWDLVPGANHPKEDEALTPEKVDEILEWLESHRGANAVS